MNTASSSLLAACGRQLVAATVGPDGGMVAANAIEVRDVIQHAALAGDGARIYLACSDGGIGRPGTRHALEVLAAGPDGQMRQVGSLALPQRPLHLAVDEAHGRVHLASNMPSAYACVSLGPGGGPVAIAHHVRDRQLAGHFAHQALPFDRTGRVLLVCRGDDGTASAPENPGSLRLLALENGQVRVDWVVAPKGGFGFGPRNCAISPDGRFLFVVLERQNRLAVFRIVAGELASAPAFEVTTLSSTRGQAARQLAGDICLHATGRMAYVLNRSRDAGGENSVAAFAIDAETGRPSHRQTLPLPGRHPRTVRLSADGAWLAIAVMEPDEARAQPAGISLVAVREDGSLTHRCHWEAPAGGDPVMWADFRTTAQ